MEINDIRIVGKPLVRAKLRDVEGLESWLWVTFPRGYREYMTTLGEGLLAGSFIRIYPPWTIGKELPEWRRRIAKYWFWDAGRKLLPKERAMECVILGDTTNGDELIFHPSHRDRIFVLPRDSEKIFEAGADVLSAIQWICTSGKLTEPITQFDFEPFDSRAEAGRGDRPVEPKDPEGESLDALMELAKQWAERHSSRKRAGKDLKRHVSAAQKTELLYESLVLDGPPPHEPRYEVAWRVVDKRSGREIGVFRWQQSEDSFGSSYDPSGS